MRTDSERLRRLMKRTEAVLQRASEGLERDRSLVNLSARCIEASHQALAQILPGQPSRIGCGEPDPEP